MKFLRSIGQAPKVDLRRKLAPSQKTSISRRVSTFGGQFDVFQQGRTADFIETNDKEILTVANRIWGNDNTSSKGFFVPRGPLPKRKGDVSVKIVKDKRTGRKSIKRKVGRHTETYFPPPPNLTDEGLNNYFDSIKLPKLAKGQSYGFLVDKTISKSFSSFEELKKRFNEYIPAIQKGTLDITGIVAINV